MMKKKIIILVILLVISSSIVYLFFRSKKWLDEIKYGIGSDIKFNAISFSETSFVLPIWIYNPTPLTLILSDLNFQIFFDQQYISSIISDKSYEIVSKKNSTYPLTVKIQNQALLQYLKDNGMVLGDPRWKELVQISVIGTISAESGIIGINKIPIKLEQNLKYYTG